MVPHFSEKFALIIANQVIFLVVENLNLSILHELTNLNVPLYSQQVRAILILVKMAPLVSTMPMDKVIFAIVWMGGKEVNVNTQVRIYMIQCLEWTISDRPFQTSLFSKSSIFSGVFRENFTVIT